MSQANKRKAKLITKENAAKKTLGNLPQDMVSSLTSIVTKYDSLLKEPQEANLRNQPNFDFLLPEGGSKKGSLYCFNYYKYKLIDSLLIPLWKKIADDESAGKKLFKKLVIEMHFNTYEILYLAYMLEQVYLYGQNSPDKEAWIAAVAYKVKLKLNEKKDDPLAFANCNADNIYIKARILLIEEEKYFGSGLEYQEPAFHELNKEFWSYFNELFKVIGHEDLNKTLSELMGLEKHAHAPKATTSEAKEIEEIKEKKLEPRALSMERCPEFPSLSSNFFMPYEPSASLIPYIVSIPGQSSEPRLFSSPQISYGPNMPGSLNFNLSNALMYPRYND